jgi:hypothetical protein
MKRSPFNHEISITTVNKRSTFFFLDKFTWNEWCAVQLSEILLLCPLKWEYGWIRDKLICWILNICCLFTLQQWDVFPCISIFWCHKVVRHKTSRATLRLSFITTLLWYNILYLTLCIRQAAFFNSKGKFVRCLLAPTINNNSNIASFFRFVDKRAIYR